MKASAAPAFHTLFICLALGGVPGFAAGQVARNAHWYFGFGAGVRFGTGGPVADTSGALQSIECSAVMSDALSNLLFYTNGETVWNRTGAPMPNGTGMQGYVSSLQGALIVPCPRRDSLYYLFTSGIATGSTGGARYSVINGNLAGGFGDVTSTKNILLLASGTEELAGTMHCNAVDYWVLTREPLAGSLRFYAYPVTETGVGTPVLSAFPAPTAATNRVSCLSFSQDGASVAFSSFGTPIYLFAFDKQTGELQLRDSIPHAANEMVYSNAFSPDGRKLYTTSWTSFTPPEYSWLSQYDLSAADVPASRVNLDSVDFSLGSPNGYGFIGQLKLAPDGRIYASRWHQKTPYLTHPGTDFSLDSLDAVTAPDAGGYAAAFQRNFLWLKGRPTQIGLPNFVSNFTTAAPLPPPEPCETPVARADAPRPAHAKLLFSFSPNPCGAQTTLHAPAGLRGATLAVCNSLGQPVLTYGNLWGSAAVLDCSALPPGLYFVRIVEEGTVQSGVLSVGVR